MERCIEKYDALIPLVKRDCKKKLKPGNIGNVWNVLVRQP
jgi:hypothetical protein